MDDYFEQFYCPEADDFHHSETPAEIDWQDREALPFRNPIGYVAGSPMLAMPKIKRLM